MNKNIEVVIANEYFIQMDQVIGQGVFGKVYKGRKANGEGCAVRIIQKEILSKDQRKNIEINISLLKGIKSENIVKLLAFYETSRAYYFVLELCTMNLKEYLFKNKPLHEKTILNILKQICLGYNDLLIEGIIHRNIKLENIFVVGDIIKLSDPCYEELSEFQGKQCDSYLSTQLHKAPQRITGAPYSTKADIFSIGVVFYLLCHNGELPWGKFDNEYLTRVKTIPKISPNLCLKFSSFIVDTLQYFQKDRLAATSLLFHSVFSNTFQNTVEYNENIVQFSQQYFTLDPNKSLLQSAYVEVIDDLSKKPRITLQMFFNGICQSKEVEELDREHFQTFLRTIGSKHIKLTTTISDFIFKKFDTDESEGISFQEIISLIEARKSEVEEMMSLKIKLYFLNLYVFLENCNEHTLKTVFFSFADEDTGKLTLQLFMDMLQKLQVEMPEEDKLDRINKQKAFKEISKNSKDQTISFPTFKNFYIKLLNLPNDSEKEILNFSTKKMTESRKKKKEFVTNPENQMEQQILSVSIASLMSNSSVTSIKSFGSSIYTESEPSRRLFM